MQLTEMERELLAMLRQMTKDQKELLKNAMLLKIAEREQHESKQNKKHSTK